MMRMAITTRRFSMALAGLAALAFSLPAAAHPGHGETGFAAGLLHPLTGLDHLLALLAVGLWSRRRGFQGHGGVLAPAFLVAMALGASTGLVPPALETSVAATVLLLGALAASGLRMAPQMATLLAGGCGFLHGLAHGQELSGMASGAGFLLASALVIGIGALIGHRLRPGLSRIAGAAIGAAGLCLLAGVV
ncbi:HupE/UreJ family protein [Massilia sp. 9096]|uniref:HupE/UreJ family protein n=1 Tax=Massilia sp. 9096 TaxID=1500894 RepID=UPI0018CFABCA|nr:HupE/UreJ family protein [Massilia sp. 9096]